MASFKPYFEVSIPKEYSPEERQAIALEIIDYVVSRTERGLDKNNEKFAKYSKTYAKEKGQSNVDLTFSGDMLAELQLLQEKSGKIRVGYDKSYDGLGKVEGNILATYGNDRPVTKPRDYLGITEKDLEMILAKYPLDDKEARRERVEVLKDSDIAAREIAKNSEIFDE